MSDALDSYSATLIKFLSDESTGTGGVAEADARGKFPGMPAIPGNPGVTPKPAVPPPPQTAAPTPTPSVPELPKIPEAPPAPVKHPEAAELEANAKDKLQASIEQLMRPDANLGLNFNDAWINRLNSSAVPHTGLSKDFPRKTGVNDVGHKKTLRYSRLVDALNNRRYIGPAKGGASGVIHGHGMVSVGNTAIGPGDIYKMDGLETAESRAQKRAEGYEQQETGREINRREDVKDMPAALERLKQLAVQDQAGKLTDAQRAEQQQLFTSLLNNQYNLPYMMMNAKYMTELGMTPQRFAAELGVTARKYDTELNKSTQQYQTMLAMQLAQYAASNGLTTQEYAAQLGMDHAHYNTMLSAVMQQFGTTLAEYMQRTIGIAMPLDKVSISMANPNYLYGAMQSSAFGITGFPDWQARIFNQALQQTGVDINNPSLDTVLPILQRLLAALERYGVSSANASAQGIQ
jgi:hypothetical protein